MAEEIVNDGIVNRVEASGLIQIDLGELLPRPAVASFDLADHLWQGLVLREKEFREAMRGLEGFEGRWVALRCSADAVIPDWAWMLATSALIDAGAEVAVGKPEEVATAAQMKALEALDVEGYRDARLIVKGCGGDAGPEVWSGLVCKLQPVVKSLMFGEACSTVPIFKRRQ
jgi:hypothetical protein